MSIRISRGSTLTNNILEVEKKQLVDQTSYLSYSERYVHIIILISNDSSNFITSPIIYLRNEPSRAFEIADHIALYQTNCREIRNSRRDYITRALREAILIKSESLSCALKNSCQIPPAFPGISQSGDFELIIYLLPFVI